VSFASVHADSFLLTGREQWRRSTFCANSACVEVASVDVGVAMRDSTVPSAVVRCSVEDFAAFVAGVKAGEYDDLLRTGPNA